MGGSMDLKSKLDKMVSDETERLTSEEHRKKSFKDQQRRAFDAIRGPLAEIVRSAGPAVTRFYAGESYAEVKFGEEGRIETSYEIEPNSVGKFSSSPSPAAGFLVKATTTYDYGFKHGLGYIEPTVTEHCFPSLDALLDDLMKQMAKAIASNKRNQQSRARS